MEKENIQALLDKYYAGETTDAEEAMLMDYFATNADEEAFPADSSLFASLLGAKAENAPHGLERRLGNMIDGLAEAERKSRIHLSLRWGIAAAAAILLCGIVGISVYRQMPQQQLATQRESGGMADTYDNPEQAMAMAETALLTFSEKLNKGLKPLEKAQHEHSESR